MSDENVTTEQHVPEVPTKKVRTLSAETREKIRQAKLGTKHTEATKEKIRQARLGKHKLFSKNPARPRQLMSAAKKGNQYSRGRHHTEEARAKMREAHQRRREARLLNPPPPRTPRLKNVEPVLVNGKLNRRLARAPQVLWQELLNVVKVDLGS